MATSAVMVNATLAVRKHRDTTAAADNMDDVLPAVLVLQRAIRRKKLHLKKKVFADRLDVEAQLGVGATRLILYIIAFLLIIASSSTGVSSYDKRGVSTLLTDSLRLKDFMKITSLESLRDFLPLLSSRLKQYAMTSSARFVDEDAIELLGSSTRFLAPKPMLGLKIPLSEGDFTFTAWVDLESSNVLERLSIIRKPLASDPALSCWAWSYPSQLRFGAHDFHSLLEKPPAWEEIVEVPGRASGLTHEALIVSNSTASFFRNGELLQRLHLPRALTDCALPGVIEVGDSGLILSSVKFYPRALLPGEIREIFFGGQPLSEVATGSQLKKVLESNLMATEVLVNAASGRTDHGIQQSMIQSEVGAVLGIAAANRILGGPDPLWPADGSPVAVLSSMPQAERILARSEREYAEWERGGRPRGFERVMTNVFGQDSLGEYWSMWEEPLYWTKDSSMPGPFSNGTQLPDASEIDGLTLSWWGKPIHVRGITYCGIGFTSADAKIAFWIEGHFDGVHVCVEEECVAVMGYVIGFDEETQRPDKSFITSTMTPGQADGPVVWRHTAVVLDWTGGVGSMTVYLDGRQWQASAELPASWDASLFRGLQLNAHPFWEAPPSLDPKTMECQLAQVRMYASALSPRSMLELQDAARWPDGSVVKQCVDMATDREFGDSVLLDEHQHSCAWYNNMRKTNPEVCTNQALLRCPLSCDGVRKCYDGTMAPKVADVSKDVKTHRIFDRVMHLKPRNGSTLCPSSEVRREEVLAGCREWQDRELPPNWQELDAPMDPSWIHFPFKANLRDCEQLAAVLDEDQCEWDASWVPKFRQEFARTRAVSLSFWMHARGASLGMPHNFWPAISLYSRLVNPFELFRQYEQAPHKESSWFVFFGVGGARYNSSQSEDDIENKRITLRPTDKVPYATEWTHVHLSLEEVDGGVRSCSALNFRSPTEGFCRVLPGATIVFGERMVEGLEVTTEMLLSPVEVTARSFSLSEVQRRFYSKRSFMRRITGPDLPEPERRQRVSRHRVKEVRDFDQRVALLAPPLLFQTRAKAHACSRVTAPFLSAQWQLVGAAHCTHPDMCPSITSPDQLSTCLGDPLSDSYFGLEQSTLNGVKGYADILYSLADNEVVVREGKAIKTRLFLDGQTTGFSLLIVLHAPGNGLSTVLSLTGDVTGYAVKPKMSIVHYSFVDDDKVVDTASIFFCLIGCIALIVLLNLRMVAVMLSDKRRWGVPPSRSEVVDVAYDFFQAAVLLAFCGVSFSQLNGSEAEATDMIASLAAVPFAEPIDFKDKTATFFLAMDQLSAALVQSKQVATLAFAIMILMLVRVFKATEVHPRIGVLVDTLRKGANDMYHFALLFLLIFFFLASVAQWIFADSREDFKDLATSMETQFNLLLGSLPEGDWRDDPRMIVYVVFSTVIQFFLMLNFLLAIVVEAYMNAREAIEENEAEQEFFHDVYLTAVAAVKGTTQRWPSKRAMSHIVRTLIASRQVSATHLEVQQFPPKVAASIIRHYHSMDSLKDSPPPWLRPARRIKKPTTVEPSPPPKPEPPARRRSSFLGIPLPVLRSSVENRRNSVENRRGSSPIAPSSPLQAAAR